MQRSRALALVALLGISHPSIQTNAQTAAQAPESAEAQPDTPRILPGTRQNAFGTIQGRAVDSANTALANAPLRLRDARSGRAVGRQATDREGAFVFSGVDPGTYVVELLKSDQTILGTSPIVNLGAGDAVTAVVRLPVRPILGGLLGHNTAQALAVTAAAAAAGVLAIDVVGQDVTAVR